MGELDNLFDDYIPSDEDDQPSEKHCKFCGRGNLTWEDDNGKWILIDCASGEIHRCKGKKLIDSNKLMDTKL